MKNLTLVALVISIINLSPAFGMGEKKTISKNTSDASEAYVTSSLDVFTKTIRDYNKNRKGQNNLVSSLTKTEDKKVFKNLVSNSKIENLPQARQVGDKAYLLVGKNIVAFSVLSLAQGEILINDKKVSFAGSDMKEKFKRFQMALKKSKGFSFLSLIIPEAVAEGPTEGLDILLVASIMKITTDFEDRGLCALCEDENEEQMKKNFDRMIKKMSGMADACESSGMIGYTDKSKVGKLASDLNNIQEYGANLDDDSELNKKLDEKFKMLDDDEIYKKKMTCGQLAYLAHKKEAHDKFRHLTNKSKGALAGYIGSTTAGTQEDGEKFEKFLSEKCEAHARLMTCLATNSDYGRDVYNRAAGRDQYKRIKIGRDISEEYIHHTIYK